MNETRIAEIRTLVAHIAGRHAAHPDLLKCGAALTELLGEVERLTERAEAAAETKLAKAKEALHQCIGNLKAVGAENGWGAEIARKTISEIEES
jgi:hypothetical protein